jgi:uncharacterized membrane protein YdjX (TVP38/TMEM64 family)
MSERHELRAIRVRLGLLFAVVTVLAAAILLGLALNAHGVADFLDGNGAAAPPLTLAAVAVLTPALVSSGLLCAAAGYVLGLALGFPVALAGLTAGALLAVWIVRRLVAPGAARALGSRIERFAAWLQSRSLRSVIFARLVPGLPFAYTSYACGLTSISSSRIAAGTAIGFAPRCFVYTALGGSLHDLGSPEARLAIAATVAIGIGSLVVPRAFPVLQAPDKTRRKEEYRWTI